MIQTLVAALMWALVASLLILRRGRTDRNITYSALTIAIAMTLNVDAIYVVVDRVLGATNLATLLSDGLLMIGLFFLGRAAMKAGEYRPRLVRAAVGPSALFIALLGASVTFMFIDRGSTTVNFMIDLGAQPWAATYSIIAFTYCGIVVAAMLNDFNDLAALPVAAVYCDVVVTEKLWVHWLQQGKVDERYKTKLLSDAAGLVAVLGGSSS